MIENWFTNKCMTLIGADGRALKNDALAAARQALEEARSLRRKIWIDGEGNYCWKKRALFSRANPLVDKNGNRVRICGHLVKVKANFCSKCGGPAPGGWWRCGGCGQMIGNESNACPHCGRHQNVALRYDLADGMWKKGDEVFAERFEFQDVAALLPKGLNVQESHCAILLEGGAVTDVLEPGFYQAAEFDIKSEDGDRSIVMVDNAEFAMPVIVKKIRTMDNFEAALRVVVVLRFNPAQAKNFMCNLMDNCLYLNDDALTASLGYDAIAHSILQDVDGAARNFCNTQKIDAIFKDPDVRMRLEELVAERLVRNLDAIGMQFVRLKEVEFESGEYDEVLMKSREVEARRREIEFMERADELADNATRRKALSGHEMEDYMKQLAHEMGIKDELRDQEIARLRMRWEAEKQHDKWKMEYEELEHENSLDSLQQKLQLARDMYDAEHNQALQDLEHSRELARRLEAVEAKEKYSIVNARIAAIELDVRRKQDEFEQISTRGWLSIKQAKKEFENRMRIEMMKAMSGINMQAIIATEDDEDKRRDLLRMYEVEMQSRMTPEAVLAVASANGNVAAAEALSSLNNAKIAATEQFNAENRAMYERMNQQLERMFNQATNNMAKNTAGNTTQIIK